MAFRSTPSTSRSPVNSASPSRSSGDRRRTSTASRLAARRPARCTRSVDDDVLPADALPRRVRAAAEPEPLAVGPVFQVVARPAPRPRDVRDLVLLVAGRVEPLHRRQIHRRDVIVGRLRPAGARHLVLERRVRVDLEHVEREVLGRRARSPRRPTRATRSTRCRGSHIIRSRLTLSKPAARASAERRARAVGAVQARQPPQLVVAKRLHAEAEAIDAGARGTPPAAPRSPFRDSPRA